MRNGVWHWKLRATWDYATKGCAWKAIKGSKLLKAFVFRSTLSSFKITLVSCTVGLMKDFKFSLHLHHLRIAIPTHDQSSKLLNTLRSTRSAAWKSRQRKKKNLFSIRFSSWMVVVANESLVYVPRLNLFWVNKFSPNATLRRDENKVNTRKGRVSE